MSNEPLDNKDELLDRLSQGPLQGCTVQGVDLTGADLRGAEATDVTFRRVPFEGGSLEESRLSRVQFVECSMRGSRLSGARMRGCTFFSAELIEARLDHTSLSGASFLEARLSNADFTGAQIQESVFNACELFGARFPRALIMNTRFESPQRGNVALDRADFSRSVLVDCDLVGASLYGANFDHAVLVKVDLRQANLGEVSFRGAQLIDVQMDLSELDPRQVRELEEARVEDPWRRIGFLEEVLSEHSPEELRAILEMTLRTYVIGEAKSDRSPDSLANLVSRLKAQHDLPELGALRVRGTEVEVRVAGEWTTLDTGGGRPAQAGTPSPEPGGDLPDAPADETAGNRRGSDPYPQVSLEGPGPDPSAGSGEPEPTEESAPLDTGTFRKLKHLEID